MQRTQYDQMMHSTHYPNQSIEKYIPLRDMNVPPHRTAQDLSQRAKSCCGGSPEEYIPLPAMNTKQHRTSYDVSMLNKYNSLALNKEYYANTPLARQTPYNYSSFFPN